MKLPKRTLLMHAAVLMIGTLATFSPAEARAQQTQPLSPRQTYLRTNGDAGAQSAQPIELSALGLQPGDPIRLERLGDFGSGGGFGDQVTLVGVFSSTSDLLGPASPQRVPGALEAGADVTTLPTFVGGLPTDIPQDFAITGAGNGGGTVLLIPEGAEYLFLSPNDSFFSDNTDSDSDYAVRITLLDTDRDGVLDNVDEQVPSDTRPQVDTGSGPTTVPNVVFPNGVTIQDYVNAYQAAAKNHGQYVSAISKLANDLARQGLITGSQKGELVSGAARSGVGK